MFENDDTIQMPVEVPAQGKRGRTYIGLPEDKISKRIGIACAVSLGVNFLVLCGASVLANSNTITPLTRDPKVIPSKIELRDPIVAKTPDVVKPTPQPTPPAKREVVREKVRKKEQAKVTPAKTVGEQEMATESQEAAPNQQNTSVEKPSSIAPALPKNSNTEAITPVETTVPRTTENPTVVPAKPNTPVPTENVQPEQSETVAETQNLVRENQAFTTKNIGTIEKINLPANNVKATDNDAIAEPAEARPNNGAANTVKNTRPQNITLAEGSTIPNNPTVPAMEKVTLQNENRPSIASQKVTFNSPKLLTMSAETAKVTETNNVVPAGEAVRAGQAVAQLGNRPTNTRATQIAGEVRAVEAAMEDSANAKPSLNGRPGSLAVVRRKGATPVNAVPGIVNNARPSDSGEIANTTDALRQSNQNGRPVNTPNQPSAPSGDVPSTVQNGAIDNISNGNISNQNNSTKGLPAPKGAPSAKKVNSFDSIGTKTTDSEGLPNDAPGTRPGNKGVNPTSLNTDTKGNKPATNDEAVKADDKRLQEAPKSDPVVSDTKKDEVKTERPDQETTAKRESAKPAEAKGPKPTIPENLRSEQFTAKVKARFNIAESGRFTVELTESSGNKSIDAYVVSYLRQTWRCKPAEQNGKKEESSVTVSITLNVN
jgi:hypothetical protein